MRARVPCAVLPNFRARAKWRGLPNHGIADVAGRDEAELDGRQGRAGAVVDAEPQVRVLHVALDGAHAEDQRVCDLLVRMAARDERKDLSLAGAEDAAETGWCRGRLLERHQVQPLTQPVNAG